MKSDQLLRLADYYEKISPTMKPGELPAAALIILQGLIATLQGCIGAAGSGLSKYFVSLTPGSLNELKPLLNDSRMILRRKTALPYDIAGLIHAWNRFKTNMKGTLKGWFVSSIDQQLNDFKNASGMKEEVDKTLSWLPGS